MSELKVEICRIKEVTKHPNADRLDLVTVKGWQCVTGKGQFSPDDLVVYIPIDSILPIDIETILFPPDSKIKLHKSRVKTIKIRGEISQGMVVPPAELGLASLSEGIDVTERLGITKWEPPIKGSPQSNCQPKKKKDKNPYFHEYTDIQHLKNYPDVFDDNTPVIATEKIHGTNFRAGYVPEHSRTWWQKIIHTVRNWLNLPMRYEFAYGSRRVQLQYKKNWNGFYDENVYHRMVRKYHLDTILCNGVVVYGEIYGDGIQKGYNYGLNGEVDLVVFDVMHNGEYLDYFRAKELCKDLGLRFVPEVYAGSYGTFKFYDRDFVSGPSMMEPVQPIREGVVLRPWQEQHCKAGRAVFKLLNPDYLLRKGNTEWQ